MFFCLKKTKKNSLTPLQRRIDRSTRRKLNHPLPLKKQTNEEQKSTKCSKYFFLNFIYYRGGSREKRHFEKKTRSPRFPLIPFSFKWNSFLLKAKRKRKSRRKKNGRRRWKRRAADRWRPRTQRKRPSHSPGASTRRKNSVTTIKFKKKLGKTR